MLIIIGPRHSVVTPPVVEKVSKYSYIWYLVSPFFKVISNCAGIQQDVHLKSGLMQASIILFVTCELDQLDLVNIAEAVKYPPYDNIIDHL